MWDPAKHLTDNPEWLVDPSMRRRRQLRCTLRYVILTLALAVGAMALVLLTSSVLRRVWFDFPSWVSLLLVVVASGLVGLAELPGLSSASLPGCRKISARHDERPGMKAVRDARRAALRTRSAASGLDPGPRERLAPSVDELDAAVLVLADVAQRTSDPTVVADLASRAGGVDAVAAQIHLLSEELTKQSESGATDAEPSSQAEPELFPLAAALMLGGVDFATTRAKDDVSALSYAFHELRTLDLSRPPRRHVRSGR